MEKNNNNKFFNLQMENQNFIFKKYKKRDY